MPRPTPSTDRSYGLVGKGDQHAFAEWVARVEPVLWRSLRSFAASADVEGIVQETLLRMWVLAPRLELSGKNASVRYAMRLARNLAISEARRHKRIHLVAPEALEREADESLPDAGDLTDPLQAAVRLCIEKLPERPRQALEARLEDDGASADRTLAELLDMAVNTFHKNLSRARALLAECLGRHGMELGSHTR